jgi:hypothetical protein
MGEDGNRGPRPLARFSPPDPKRKPVLLHVERRSAKADRRESSLRSLYSVLRLPILFFAGLVAFGEAIRPDPIPNSAVKRLRANGTLSQDTGE